MKNQTKCTGGTCINVGCIPSKSLISSSQESLSFAKAMAAKEELITKLRKKNYHMIADEATATVLDGKATFLSNTEIQVTDTNGRSTTITGDRIFINTGAIPVIPEIEGVASNPYVVTSKEIMELDVMPEKLVVIGSGYIGLEFASMFATFGAKVTVVDASPTFLPKEDEDISNRIYQDLTDRGIALYLGVSHLEVKDGNVSFTKGAEKVTVAADKVLLATGRRPNTDSLGLENTNIEVTERGAIKVNDVLETTVPNIWAIGDVWGGPQFTYTSLDDFRIIQNQLFGDKTRSLADRTLIPYSVFITPALSHVGLTEKGAKNQGIPYQLFQLEAGNVPKAHILKNPRGMFKALVDPETKEMLGATIYALDSYEVINVIALAIKAKQPYTVLRDFLYTHPTIGEALNDLFK